MYPRLFKAINRTFNMCINSSFPLYLFRRASRLWTDIIPDRIDKGHTSRHLQITRPSTAPIVLFEMYDSAIVPCLLVFLILRLDDSRCLDCALLEEVETLAAL